MRFDQFKIRMDKDWLEERLKKPFVRERVPPSLSSAPVEKAPTYAKMP
jgi:hypothetical protein